MSPTQRRYLLVEQGVVPAVVDFVINAGFAWLFFRRLGVVPLDGDLSIAGDTVVTSLLLPFFTSLINTRLARGEVMRGRIAPLSLPAALRWLPRWPSVQGLILGVLTIVLLGLPTIALLRALGVSSMSFGGFVLSKSSYAALAGMIVTPPIGLLGLASAPLPQPDALRRGSAA